MSTWTNGRALCFEQTPGHGPSTSGSSNRVATPFYTYHNAEDYMYPRLDVGIDDNHTWFQITDLLENAENVGTWLPTYIPKDETNHYASSVTEDHTATISRSYVDEQSANHALVSFSATLSESSPETTYTDSLGTPRETTQEIVLEPVPAKPGSANASQQTQAAGPSRALVDSTTPTIPDPSHTPPSSSKTGPAKRKQTVRKKPAAVPTKPKRVKPRQVSQAEIDEQMFLAELRRREQEEARALKKSVKRPRKSRAKRPIKPPSPPPVAQDDPPIPSLPMASTDHTRLSSVAELKNGLGDAMTPRASSSSRQVAYTPEIDENPADGLLQSIYPCQLQPRRCDAVQANILNTPQTWSHIVGMQTGTSREQSSGMINFAPTATTSSLSSPAPYTPPSKEFVDLTNDDAVYDLPSPNYTWQKPIVYGDWGLPVEPNCDEPPAGPAGQEQATTGSDPNASTLKRKADAAEELEGERPERRRRRYTPNEMKPAIGTLVNEERNGFRHVGSEMLGQYRHIPNAVSGPPSYFNPYPIGFCVPMLAPDPASIIGSNNLSSPCGYNGAYQHSPDSVVWPHTPPVFFHSDQGGSPSGSANSAQDSPVFNPLNSYQPQERLGSSMARTKRKPDSVTDSDDSDDQSVQPHKRRKMCHSRLEDATPILQMHNALRVGSQIQREYYPNARWSQPTYVNSHLVPTMGMPPTGHPPGEVFQAYGDVSIPSELATEFRSTSDGGSLDLEALLSQPYTGSMDDVDRDLAYLGMFPHKSPLYC